MGLWNLYFIAKLGLYFADYIDFDVWLNLALATALLLPSPSARGWRFLRLALVIPAAIALFYHDTRFPPFSRLIAQSDNLSQFSADYLAELLMRFIDPKVVLAGVALLLLSLMAARKLRLSSFVLLAIVPGVPLHQYLKTPGAAFAATATTHDADTATGIAPPGAVGEPDNAALDQALDAFYKTQGERQVAFSPPAQGPDFDVVILQICSLAWDDLKLAGLERDGPMARFDLLFRQFNSATAYSGPAAIRLLRSTCGQTPHSALYQSAPQSCYLFEQFANAGFQPRMLLNHDGRFGNMLSEIQSYGGLAVKPDDISDLPDLWLAFDGSPVKDDHAALTRWLKQRQQAPAGRMALFYNSTSLHDGNHPAGAKADASSAAAYGERARRLLDDINRFLDDLEASGRKTVVIMIPEHGAGSRGDRMQIPFMRENPSPAITLVPVGVRLVGLPKPAAQVEIKQPASYIDLAELIRDMLQQNPYAAGGPDARTLASGIGGTPYVAENEGSVVARYGPHFHIRYQDSAWSDYAN